MVAFTSEQIIERSAAAVYDLAVDVLRHPQWMNVLDARLISGEPSTVGARASEHMRVGPRTYDIEFELTEADPGRRITWRVTRGGPFTGEVTLGLEPIEPDRTRATYAGRIDLKGLRRLIAPFMTNEIRAEEAGELVRLKALAEAQSAGATVPATLATTAQEGR
jgi:uncharacterized membrane protein